MKALYLPPRRSRIHPSRRAKRGTARNYSDVPITESFAFYGEDISGNCIGII